MGTVIASKRDILSQLVDARRTLSGSEQGTTSNNSKSQETVERFWRYTEQLTRLSRQSQLSRQSRASPKSVGGLQSLTFAFRPSPTPTHINSTSTGKHTPLLSPLAEAPEAEGSVKEKDDVFGLSNAELPALE